MDTLIPTTNAADSMDNQAGAIVKLGRKRIALTGSDMTTLHLLNEHKFLTAQQVAKFIHTETRQFKSSVRLATLRLNRLYALNLIALQAGQVGGASHGAAPNIWHLAKLGHDVLEKLRRIETNESKKPFKAPRYTFAAHRMAINDTKLILKRIADTHEDVRLGEALIEEKSWRYYTNQAGVATSLRPDMYAVTHRGQLKHHWFIEVDCNTEAPVRIIAKCNMYLDYMACTIDSGDGWCCGQFPAVLWVVPTIKRRNALQRHIAENFPDFPVGQPFIVVTPQELPALIAEGKLGELREVSYE